MAYSYLGIKGSAPGYKGLGVGGSPQAVAQRLVPHPLVYHNTCTTVESTSAMMNPQGLNLVCLFFYPDVKIIRKLSRRRRGTRVQGEEGCIPLQLS